MFPEPFVPPFLGGDPGGTASQTTHASRSEMALQVPTVFACVALLAGSVASLPLETFRRANQPDSVPQRIADPGLLRYPDAGVTQSEWLHMVMVSMLLRGNAYGLITGRDSYGYPLGVHILNPDKVTVHVDDAGLVSYTQTTKNGTQKPVPDDDMWHVRGLTLPGSVVGVSPIACAAAVSGLDLSSRRFASGFFEGDGIPKAILESDQQVSQEQARTVKDRVMATFRNREPAVLGLGLRYTQIQVRPEESQFLATQNANATQICRFFGVPAAMVDAPAGNSMNYSNTEMRGIEFLTYSLAKWLRRIEDAMFRLLPGAQYVKFDVKSLLRLDAKTQAQVDLFELAGKIVAPSEVRAGRGLPPMTPEQKEEADMVPLSISPLGRPSGGAMGALHEVEDPAVATPVPAGEDPANA